MKRFYQCLKWFNIGMCVITATFSVMFDAPLIDAALIFAFSALVFELSGRLS